MQGRAGHAASPVPSQGCQVTQCCAMFGTYSKKLYIFHLKFKFRCPAFELGKFSNSVYGPVSSGFKNHRQKC